MPCQCYNNGGLGSCAGCCHFNKSTAIALVGTVLQITIGPQTLRNKEKICVTICQNIPAGVGPNTTVSIVVSGVAPVTVPVFLKDGNKLYGDQVRTRKVLHLETATDVPSFVVCPSTALCCTDHAFPIINTATAAAPAEPVAPVSAPVGGNK